VLPDHQVEGQTGQLERARLFRLFLDLLSCLAAQRTIVLLLEDLHWADTSSLDLLLFLARNLRRQRVLLGTTYRTDEVSKERHQRSVFVELIRNPGAYFLELGRFSLPETAALLRAASGARLTDTVIRQVHERSGGNAFLAQELLAAEERNPHGPLPDHLRDLLMMRVEVLSDEGHRVVAVVATAGRPTPARP